MEDKLTEMANIKNDNTVPVKYMERFMQFAQNTVGDRDAVITVTNFAQSCSMELYRISGQEIMNDNEAFPKGDLFNRIMMEVEEHFLKGIHLFRFSGSQCTDQRHISHFNPELLFNGEDRLAIYQEYGLEPKDENGKKQLEQALKAEKIKNTLVYACYENDNEKIIQYLASDKLNKAQLNKVLHLCGTPLIICAKNDNLQAFRAIAEKGADVSKKFSGRETALWTAMIYSYDIVQYIFENYRQQFDKEVTGFLYACYTKDVRVLQLLKDLGFDLCCEGQKFPPLHTFVDYGNLVGIRFLLDNGVDVNLKNQFGQTALERAQNEDLTEVIALLEHFIHPN